MRDIALGGGVRDGRGFGRCIRKDGVGDGAAAPEVIDLTDLGTLTDFLATLSPSIGGLANATLPVYFPTESEFLGDITFAASFSLDGDGLSIGTPTLTIPNLTNIDLSSLNPFNR